MKCNNYDLRVKRIKRNIVAYSEHSDNINSDSTIKDIFVIRINDWTGKYRCKGISTDKIGVGIRGIELNGRRLKKYTECGKRLYRMLKRRSKNRELKYLKKVEDIYDG